MIFLISVFFTIFKLIEIFDYESIGTFNVWFFLSVFLLIIALFAIPASFTQMLRYLKELISLIRKQKGKERIKTEIVYNMPDEATQIYLKKISGKSPYYLFPMFILSIIFMIFYFVVDSKYNNTIFSLLHYTDSEDPEIILTDLFAFLGFISIISLFLIFFPIFEFLKRKKKGNAESKDTQISKLGIFPSFHFRKKHIKNTQQDSVESNESEEPFDMKNKISDINFQYGICLFYGLSYVFGIPLKIFIPLYIKYGLNEVSLVINILNFTFYGIFLIYLFLILREVVPAWKIFKKNRIKI